jgi:transcriptional regulator of arginine metabolism
MAAHPQIRGGSAGRPARGHQGMAQKARASAPRNGTRGRRRAQSSQARRVAVERLIRDGGVETQESLREKLALEGFEVTQATLSRDLARLRARRVALPQGGTVYELEGAPAAGSIEGLSGSRKMVTAVLATDALVVVRTTPGAASAVALAVDQARLADVAGTIAGDDTLFIAPHRQKALREVARRLEVAWGLPPT